MGFSGGHGVTFNIGDGDIASSPTYTAIAQVEEWNGIEIGAIMSEVTNHGLAWRQKVPSGLFEVGNIELKLAFDITQVTHANASGGVTHALLNKTKLAYQIVLPSSILTFTYNAYVQKIKWESPKGEHIMGTVTFEVTGETMLS